MDMLPTETKVLIFSFLNTKELLTTRLICKEWNELARAPVCWKDKIQQYFSYLLKTKRNCNDFYELYRAEYFRYSELIKLEGYQFGMQQLFDALSGNLSHIGSAPCLKDKDILFLYIHALGNGHSHALGYLKIALQKKSDKAIFLLSIRMDVLSAVQYFVEKKTTIDSRHIIEGVEEAAGKGHLTIVQYFIDSDHGISINIDSVFHRAAMGGHIAVIQYLFEKNISLNAKGNALSAAAAQGHLHIVQYLLKHAPEIDNNDRKYAILSAAENQHHDIALFIQNIEDETRFSDKLYAFK